MSGLSSDLSLLRGTHPAPPPPPDARGKSAGIRKRRGKTRFYWLTGLMTVSTMIAMLFCCLKDLRVPLMTAQHHSKSTSEALHPRLSGLEGDLALPESERTSASANNSDDFLERNGNKNEIPLTYDYDKLLAKSSGDRVTFPHNTNPRGQLALRWIEATPDLLPLLAQMTLQQRAALGLTSMGDGFDLYGARVELTNIGTSSIDVAPTKLRVHFGIQTTAVFVGHDNRFLQHTRLQSGQTTSGLVMFIAPWKTGGIVRSGLGGMSYRDPDVETIFP